MEQSEPEATKTNEPKAKLMMEQTANWKHIPTQRGALTKTREVPGRAQVRAAPRCAMRVVFSRCGPPEVRIVAAAAAVEGGARRRVRGALGLVPCWPGCALQRCLVPQETTVANEGTLTTQQLGFALTRQNVDLKTVSLHA